MASLRFNHIGVAVPDIRQASATYQAIFGYVVLSGPFDDPIQNVSVCFLGTGEPGDLTMELVAPLGDDSPVSKMLAKGIGAYHICYEVIDKAIAQHTYCWDTPEVASFKYLFNFMLDSSIRDQVVKTLFEEHVGDEKSFSQTLY
jgi:catechol 2,3-dioxygenase-like lactoylglutathione lyase family enzyme